MQLEIYRFFQVNYLDSHVDDGRDKGKIYAAYYYRSILEKKRIYLV